MIPEGPAAGHIAQLTLALTAIGAAVYLAFLWTLARSYRRRDGRQDSGDHRTGLPTPWSRLLVVGGGVVMPAIVIVVVFGWTLETMIELAEEPDADSLTVEVVGERWRWKVHYPDSGIELTDELVIPAGRAVVLELRSDDVIHSFWVPQLAGKLDALPDYTNTLVIEADEPGHYRGQCAEFCGLNHAEMELDVTALTAAEFEAWTEQLR